MALETDNTCWHCGEPLPGREDAGRKKVKVRESWAREAGPGSVAVFAGLTLLVVVAALLVSIALGRRPQLQVRLGTRPPPNWTFYTASDESFTVSLPDSWTWLDDNDPQVTGELQAMIDGDERFRLATHPLGAEVDDLIIRFLAHGQQLDDRHRSFMIIAGSSLLNRLTYREAVSFLSQSDYDLQEVRFVDDFDKSHVRIIVNTPLTDGSGEAIRCRQQFVLGRSESLLASLCAPENAYPALASQFDEIMTTFQHLGT